MKFSKNKAFTLVELMVVVGVIVILSLITYAAYDTVVDNAINAKVAANLDSTYKKIREYHTENRVYPQSITDCPTPAATNICVDTGTAQYEYRYNNSSSPKTFSVIASENNSYFRVMNDSPVSAYTQLNWTSISMFYNPCAVGSDGNAYCWGSGGSGRLGNGTYNPSYYPTAVSKSGVLSGKTIVALSSGGTTSCVIASDNNAYCWGYNDGYFNGTSTTGILGNNSSVNDSPIPVAVYTGGVLSGKTIKAISGGYEHFCAIASDNLPYCWGRSNGNGSANGSNVPIAVDMTGVLAGKTIKAISAGSYTHTCAIASDDLAYCWGTNSDGQLGNNSTTPSTSPVAVNRTGVLAGKTIKNIDTGYNTACVIASDDKVYCWGYNGVGQLGNNSTTRSLVPVAVDTSGVLSGKTIKYLSVTEYSACAIASDDKLYCWGWAYKGDGTAGGQNTVPVAAGNTGLLSDKTIKSVSVAIGDGGTIFCVIANDNQLYCWGNRTGGELGNNTASISLVPVKVMQP